MTYHCATYGLSRIGIPDQPVTITCDSCGVQWTLNGYPPRWLQDGKSPPKWRQVKLDIDNGVPRKDYCPACKGKVKP